VPLSALCRSILAGVLIAQGDWQRAESELSTALEVYRGLGKPLAAYPLARLAGLRLLQGRLEEAEQVISGWEGHPEMGTVSVALLIERGEYTLAGARLSHQLERIGSNSPFAVELLPLLVRLRLAQGEVDAARTAADSFRQLARRLGHEHLGALAELITAQVGVAAGDEGATTSLGSAVERFARLGLVYDEGRAHLELARATADVEPELAVSEARAALAIFERLGAGGLADQTASLLRSMGITGRAAPRRPGELSLREREVLVLLEHGLSNREIADRLYISPKTASHHVSQILAKLDVRSRAEAAAFSARERTSRSGSE
jgi:DNA-binding CsgD family transcriptional regulator